MGKKSGDVPRQQEEEETKPNSVLIFHIKYNYRTSSTGDIFCDWFTVGEDIKYHVTAQQDMDVVVSSIDVGPDMVAYVTCVDADENLYSIEQVGVTTVFRKFE